MEWLFTLLIPAVAVVIIVTVAKGIASHRFRCKHCAKEFEIPWTQVLVTEHSDRKYKLVCPHCKTKDWCTLQPN